MSKKHEYAPERGEWHVDAYNMTQIIEVRQGADARGRRYIDGRHTVKIADFCLCSKELTLTEKMQNAKIASAALELLTACKYALEAIALHEKHFVHFSERDEMKNRLTLAIEKAGQNEQL